MGRRAEPRWVTSGLLGVTACLAGALSADPVRADPPAAVAANGVASVTGDGLAESAAPPAAEVDAVDEWLAETAGPVASNSSVIRRQRADRTSGRSGLSSATGSQAWETWRMAWPLGVILGIIGLITWAVRRWMPRSTGLGGGGLITILARHHLSPKQSLCLIRLGRRVLLIGVTPEAIQAVAEIDREDEAAALIAAAERGKPGSFSSVFARLSEGDIEPQSGTPETTGLDSPLASVGSEVRGLVQKARQLGSRSEASVEPT